jgi:hypothetical protein
MDSTDTRPKLTLPTGLQIRASFVIGTGDKRIAGAAKRMTSAAETPRPHFALDDAPAVHIAFWSAEEGSWSLTQGGVSTRGLAFACPGLRSLAPPGQM